MKPLVGTELKRFLREHRRRERPAIDLVFLLQSVEYPYNVGSIFRLADAAGAEEVILTGITPTPPNPTIAKVGRLKEAAVPWRYERTPDEPLGELRGRGYRIVALELTDRSVPYTTLDAIDRICLVVGHEDHGVTKATLALCDSAVFVPMYGKGRSHNVHTSLAIVAYHLLHRAMAAGE
jgi:tRNA (guanosine-2'-O-)-methyltransferase